MEEEPPKPSVPRTNVFAEGAQWVRADFHLHTRADREFKYAGDNDYYNSRYVEALEKAGIRLGVITNHNKFDFAEFKALRQTAQKRGVELLPGVELSVNDGANGIHTFIHRDYFISAPVRVLVFTDRVEIISPGHLPNNLTIENIKAGNSNIRNPILASFATKLLPYRGLGSGILRVLRAWPAIELIDDRAGNLFKAIVARPHA